jgi:ribosomal protein S18 acetylase RimI-like enzyme
LQIKIRRAEKRDIKPLEAVINEHWKVNIDHRKEIADKNAILLVVETADGSSHTTRKVVGTGLMWVTKWNKTGYLVELAVSKDSMRKGVGKALVSEFARLARRHRLRAIIVETQPDNKDGMDFYLANGFRLCGYNDRYYTNRPRSSHEIAVFFSLDLNGSAK